MQAVDKVAQSQTMEARQQLMVQLHQWQGNYNAGLELIPVFRSPQMTFYPKDRIFHQPAEHSSTGISKYDRPHIPLTSSLLPQPLPCPISRQRL
ncbi:hypothetical protein CgunFtcFv8_007104 [Champsocephalus gunnari]|uniref:Uncharacterized protein n=1 Tax=Champsocephalus gunnari TaxID=52237 RepID=A0AAN8CKX8_CHAGU|nr:hypothetical protein CgunFtcFv8_007104 [Champsocephalus gunnari]